MQFSNKWYNILKYVAIVALPALATFVLALFLLLGLDGGATIAGVITLTDTLLGTLLGISTKNYNRDDSNFDGFLEPNGIHEDTGLPNLKMVVTSTPEEILQGDRVRLKVRK
jgi:hypothetical protein